MPKSKKTADDSSALVPQPHGGALRRGNPGNKGGGRPPSELRRRLREAGADRLSVLEEIADGGEKESDRLKAVDMMLRYGLGKQVPRDAVLAFLKDAADLVASEVDDPDARKRIKDGWVELLRGHFS